MTLEGSVEARKRAGALSSSLRLSMYAMADSKSEHFVDSGYMPHIFVIGWGLFILAYQMPRFG